MAGTYSRIYLQIVFAVKGRQNLIAPSWKEELNRYVAGIVTEKGQKSIIVNSMPDHMHVFVGLKPIMRISDLVRDIKNNSTNFINNRGFVREKFCWQDGYGAFSYSPDDVRRVFDYIHNQATHHKTKSFKEEYKEFLRDFDIEFKDEYLFDWIDQS